MSESALKASVLRALKGIDVLAWSNAQGGRRYRTGLGPGSADVIACVYVPPPIALAYQRGTGALMLRVPRLARFVGLELKMPGAKPKPHEAQQAEWRRLVNAAGGFAVEVRSVYEAVEAVRAAARGEDAPSPLSSSQTAREQQGVNPDVKSLGSPRG